MPAAQGTRLGSSARTASLLSCSSVTATASTTAPLTSSSARAATASAPAPFRLFRRSRRDAGMTLTTATMLSSLDEVTLIIKSCSYALRCLRTQCEERRGEQSPQFHGGTLSFVCDVAVQAPLPFSYPLRPLRPPGNLAAPGNRPSQLPALCYKDAVAAQASNMNRPVERENLRQSDGKNGYALTLLV